MPCLCTASSTPPALKHSVQQDVCIMVAAVGWCMCSWRRSTPCTSRRWQDQPTTPPVHLPWRMAMGLSCRGSAAAASVVPCHQASTPGRPPTPCPRQVPILIAGTQPGISILQYTNLRIDVLRRSGFCNVVCMMMPSVAQCIHVFCYIMLCNVMSLDVLI